MSTATTFLKSNYLDKVNKLTKNGNEIARNSIKQLTSVRYSINVMNLNSLCIISETRPVLSIIVASIFLIIIFFIVVVFILLCRRTKKRLKPADVIPAVSINSDLKFDFMKILKRNYCENEMDF